MGRAQSIHGGRWLNLGLGLYFGLILLFLYGPIIIMAALSFQGPQGGMVMWV